MGCRYDCRVVCDEGSREIFVGEPAYLDVAVDSSEAYDRAAHAAISFAIDHEDRARDRGDDYISFEDCTFSNDQGWMIERKNSC